MALTFATHNIGLPHHLYFDETEKDDLIGVGGWLGTLENWASFESRWRKALPPEAKGDFHYTDFWARKSYGADWPDDRRIDFVRTLATIARDCTVMAVGMIFSRSVYEKTIPEEDRKKLVSPFHFAFGHCVRGLMAIHKDIDAPPPPWRVMFDHKEGQKETLAKLYYGTKAAFDTDRMFGNLSFGNRNEEPPLQAADLLVGEARRHIAGNKSVVLEVLGAKRSLLISTPQENDFREVVEDVLEKRKNS